MTENVNPAQAALALLLEQRQRWRAGTPVAAETYLQQHPHLRSEADAAVDLIYNEYLLREENGEQPDAQEFYQRFPEYGELLRAQIGLHLALSSGAEGEGEAEGRATEERQSFSGARHAPGASWPVVPDYEMLGELGRGSMGIVYQARHSRLKRVVALKMLWAGAQPDHQARFRTEAAAVARLQHPNIVQIYEVAESEGGPLLVLEFVPGGNLKQRLAGTPQPPLEAARLVETLARAVQYAHEHGVIHRDLKPANILLSDEGRVPKIADFGLAKELQVDADSRSWAAATQSHTILGTPSYMAPEQAAGKPGMVGARADVYALGAMLYEFLTGRPPFQGETPLDTVQQALADEPLPPSRLQRRIRGDLETICLKCLEKDQARRYATAAALAEDLRRFQAGEPIAARPVRTLERAWRWSCRHRAVALLMTCLALSVLVGMGGILLKWRDAEYAGDQERAASRLADDNARQLQEQLARLKAANSLLERGRWYADNLQWDDAHAAFGKALALRPDHASVWAERSELYTRLGLWDLAAADYTREAELRDPGASQRWFRHALLRLYVGDEAGYRQVCARMHEHFNGTLSGSFLCDLIRSRTLGPDPHADPLHMVRLAQEVVVGEPKSWFRLYILGIAHYRAGENVQAIARLREALAGAPTVPARDIGLPVLAMAYHRLGKANEARRALDQAARAMEQWSRSLYDSGTTNWVQHMGAELPWPIPWWDWLECQLYVREASMLLDGAPPPDPRLRVLRARAYAGLRWQRKADVEYAAALQLLPEDRQIRLEAHRNRAYLYVASQQWSRAAAEFMHAAELHPADPDLYCFQAVVRLAADDLAAYRQACADIARRFENTKDQRAACAVLLACALRDGAVPDMARLLPLTQVARPAFHFSTYLRGATLYRARFYQEAIDCFETAAAIHRPRAWDWSFLAMAHHRLGHADQARRCLDQARRWIDDANSREENDATGTHPAWGGWHERVVYPILLREAERVLRD